MRECATKKKAQKIVVMKNQQNGLEVLTASFKSGNSGAAVQLLKRGVDSPEIRIAAAKHKIGAPLRKAYEEYQAAPTRIWIKYNPDTVRFNSGEYAGREIYCNGNCKNIPSWLDTREPAPVGLMEQAFMEADAAELKWLAALTKATNEETARFILKGHYVHHTTRKLLLELALSGFRPWVVHSGKGHYTRLSETYGEYKYHDVICVDEHITLEGSEPYQSQQQTNLFGSSGSKNTWTVRPGTSRTIDVVCWH